MKKIFAVLLAASMTLSSMSALAVDDNAVKIVLDGETLNLDTDAYIKDERTMVPLRGVFESVGAKVNWVADTKTVFITKDSGDEVDFILLQAGSTLAFVNSEKKELDVAAEIVNDRTMVPLRFVMEELGADVKWDGETKSVLITTK